jgi:hypothetical protein
MKSRLEKFEKHSINLKEQCKHSVNKNEKILNELESTKNKKFELNAL